MDSIDGFDSPTTEMPAAMRKRAPRTFKIIDPILPEQGPAQARPLTSRSRMRPALSAAPSWSPGHQG
jgi:hypothetical protein